jgi:arylsulfatase A-like enzyme
MYDPADVPMPELKPGELDSKPPLQKLFRDERRGHYLKDEKLLRQIRAVYYGMITEIDDHLGRLFKEMEILGLFDNTLIIFTSDHGEYLGDHGMIEKELFYEQAIKVPMIMHWPRHIRPNTHIHEFVESIDILPTCMEAAGIPIPDALEGFSLFPLIRGEAVNWRQEVYAEWDYRYYHVRNKLELQPHQCRAVMIRDRKWKYIHYTDQPCELYDLENDPDEFFNLANDPRHFETAINLKERILNWRLRTEDSKPDADLTFATYLRNPWEGGTNN